MSVNWLRTEFNNQDDPTPGDGFFKAMGSQETESAPPAKRIMIIG